MSFYTEIKNDVLTFWDSHGTRIIAVVSGAVASVALLDPAILTNAIGPRGVALLAIGNALLTYWRGTVNAKRLQ